MKAIILISIFCFSFSVFSAEQKSAESFTGKIYAESTDGTLHIIDNDFRNYSEAPKNSDYFCKLDYQMMGWVICSKKENTCYGSAWRLRSQCEDAISKID